MQSVDIAGIAEVAPAVVGKWSRAGLSTEPVDRAAAEEAVGALYALSGVPAPREFIWCRSPAEAARLLADARATGTTETGTGTDPDERFGASLRARLRTDPWERARSALHSLLGREGFAQAWRETCAPIAPTFSGLIQEISRAVSESADDAFGADEDERRRLLLALTFADHGQHDAAWLPLFEAYREAASASASSAAVPGGGTNTGLADGPALEALARVAQQVHWWWPFARAVILCERPTALHLDEHGRLHHGDGPALAYADGFALYRWRGVAIPEGFARTLAALTPEVIRAERNLELRRIMLEHYGHERYIVDSGAKPVQEDETGRLWRVDLPRDEPVTMVEVVNSTAEPDGTFKTYWLRVPPHTPTARAAVAWTFGLTEEEYRPRVQT
jgi:hypothetical protein